MMDSASASAGSSVSSSSQPSQPNEGDANNPLWSYVTKLQKLSGAGGNTQWQCNFCGVIKKSSYTRVKGHLLKLSNGIGPCTKVTNEALATMKKLEDEAKAKMKDNAPKRVPLPPSTRSGFVLEGYDAKKQRTSGGRTETISPLEKAYDKNKRDQLHAEIARMFYSGGVPFNLARNPYYVTSYQFAANNPLSGYIPPGYNLLRTTLLQQEKTNVERLLLPIKGTWREKGVSIVSDGWSDSQRRPLINFMAVTEGGPMFLKAVDCSGETKDKYFICELMREVIEEVGPDNVVQVITDNAKNCAGAGLLIEGLYPNISWTPCVVHTLNLALQNICAAKNVENNQVTYDECSWITIIADDVSFIKNFIMNHSMRLAIFNDFVPLKLLSVASTRFASVMVMLKRFKLLKASLQTMVISPRWNSYREDDTGKAKFVKEKVLDDIWWDSIDYILSFTSPMYDMLRICDTDKPCLHLVYDMWDTMIEKVKVAIYRHEGKRHEDSSTFYDVVHTILVDRWNKNSTPLHCLAHSLNPRYYSDEWLNEGPSRVPPHKDVEVARERMKCMKKYFPNSVDRSKVNLEFANFSSKAGEFADSDSIHDRYAMDPKSWWVTYGASAPLLQSIALKLLVQPSSSSCKRNWSTYSFVHSAKRNKMTPKRAEDLVFIHSNLRLLSRRTRQYMEGQTKMWDIAGDAFDTFGDVGELEIAQLSLDEPELEAVVFMDDGDESDDGEIGDEAMED
ncbi:hypothetical protein RHGRI_026721 [Rhododendron griersonianum]|uniref:BED-type domain-containing protein n=1 Tax=Rhododendron griersonianum TaxID=479676 RepID=A0AAV6IV88_9ERIC|nr:hypothetical protein RHGRI_026721 [Rhododendron griersonianum]